MSKFGNLTKQEYSDLIELGWKWDECNQEFNYTYGENINLIIDPIFSTDNMVLIAVCDNHGLYCTINNKIFRLILETKCSSQFYHDVAMSLIMTYNFLQ